MVGHGVILANAYAEVRALAEKTGMPVITTLLGISASSYLVSKGIQFSSDDGAKHKDAGEPDGKKKKED